MAECEKCLYYKSKQKCAECGRLSNPMQNNPMFTPSTNYDRIKSMSVEEMAQELTEVEAVGYACMIPNGYDGWKEYLLQEASEDE